MIFEVEIGPDAWEHLQAFRIFYDIASNEAIVSVLAIGIKKHNRLTIGGKEFKL